MLENIASRLTDQLYLHCPLDQRKKVIYTYGIQLSLSTLASMCSIVLLGILLGDAPSAFLFLGVFFFLRLFGGGYHAPTYARCFLLTNSVYLAVVGASYWIVRFQLYHLLPCNRCGVMCSRDGSFLRFETNAIRCSRKPTGRTERSLLFWFP